MKTYTITVFYNDNGHQNTEICTVEEEGRSKKEACAKALANLNVSAD